MSNINQSGVFRGDVLDRGMATSSGGFPQLILQLRASEKYDDVNEVWIPWDYEEVDATAYLVLFGGNGKPTMNVRQCMKAFGWDGASFQALQEDQNLAKQIQWRMAESTYQEQTRIKPEWIDAYDADPQRKVQKLEVGDIKKLDAQYAAALKALGGGPKPKSAKPTAPTAVAPKADPTTVAPIGSPVPPPGLQTAAVTPPFTPDPTPSPSGTQAATSSPTPTPSASAEPAKAKRGPKPKPPVAVAPPTTPAPVPTTAPMDQGAAWESVYNRASKVGKTDLEITNTWIAVVNEVGGDEKVGADWTNVAAEVGKRLGV